MPRALIVLLVVLGAAQPVTEGVAMDRVTGRAFATRSEVLARHGMVATSQPLATQAGLEVLRAGGNAVDAAIAANAVLALTEPTGCGLGGDLFALVWDPTRQRLRGLNGSGRSPRTLTLAELQRRGLSRMPAYGPLPVTVPGCVDGWFTLHAEFGRLPIAQVLAAAIRYAREGFPVTEVIAQGWALNAAARRDQPGFAATFLPGGAAPAKGDIFRNPDLAATLEEIAAGGRDAFYEGRIAGVIADFVADAGGFLTREDLAAHRSEWVEPVCASYRGVDVWELPPNGQGIAALQILNVLEGFDLAGAGFGSADHLHWFVEAKKLAFADRARYYADPDFAAIPVAGLIDQAYADRQRLRIRPDRAARAVDAGNPSLQDGDTVYLAAADESGLMVSLIQSNYRGMGCGLCPPGLGFGLQDRGELFDLAPGRANSYAPGKRPFHTIIPGFLTRGGEPWCAFGVMGGAVQPQAHAWVVMNLLDFGMNLQEAGDAPRAIHDGSSEPTGEIMTDGGVVHLETGFAWEAVRELVSRGHRIQTSAGDFGGYQAVMWDRERGIFIGASESRKDGHAAGY
ncbi:MAG TPA: gamma-glutamyltransferase family protein [Candidatus Krumholzibacteria bacterium]|nr:gamma-glutamyltransferase family protein [Candidatus Krumholzibacteria bacterium]HPD72158.1 gamma-glutamyltransferase family protein [Candidatus Krumholzibacteria bacterium]HRY40910.1 gamma-glutamyltransferase family protein [Candidatus Krumholzibacteria bacterium]